MNYFSNKYNFYESFEHYINISNIHDLEFIENEFTIWIQLKNFTPKKQYKSIQQIYDELEFID